jgi:hypothetical protein
MGAIEGGIFDRREGLIETLRQGPEEKSRWRLWSIREAVAFLSDYSLSGVWRFLHRHGISWRSSRGQLYSPDPAYREKVAYLHQCLHCAAADPARYIVLFMDEMGYFLWPEKAKDWALQPPVEDRKKSKQKQWRLIGALNATSGKVHYLDGYIVGRTAVIRFYERIASYYAQAERIFVVQDNWSIHTHPQVMAALETLPIVEPVFLPTYAPWLNPIEKLWRLLKEEVIKLHRLADCFETLRARVCAFLDQFAEGSPDLLGYVGLRGQGKLAYALAHP